MAVHTACGSSATRQECALPWKIWRFSWKRLQVRRRRSTGKKYVDAGMNPNVDGYFCFRRLNKNPLIPNSNKAKLDGSGISVGVPAGFELTSVRRNLIVLSNKVSLTGSSSSPLNRVRL